MALAGLGGWIRYKSKDYDTILGAKGLETPANFLIAAGAIVFLVAFFGFCGACAENKCLLQFVSSSTNWGGRRDALCPRILMCPPCSGLKLMRPSELQPQSASAHELYPTARGDTQIS